MSDATKVFRELIDAYDAGELALFADAVVRARESLAKPATVDATELLRRARVFVAQDAEMMAALTRHAPLDAASQATHDTTEYESERLLPLIDAYLATQGAA